MVYNWCHVDLDQEWKHFFQGFDFAQESYEIDFNEKDIPKEFKVITLIDAYRKRGHLFTLTNPVVELSTLDLNLQKLILEILLSLTYYS